MAMSNQEQLDVLGILYYIAGGAGIIGVVVFLSYVVGAVDMLKHPEKYTTDGSLAPDELGLLGEMMLVGGAVGAAVTGTMSGAAMYSGHCLRSRRHRIVSILVAIVSCLAFPLGTALGVFTLIVLNRPDVKSMYA